MNRVLRIVAAVLALWLVAIVALVAPTFSSSEEASASLAISVFDESFPSLKHHVRDRQVVSFDDDRGLIEITGKVADDFTSDTLARSLQQDGWTSEAIGLAHRGTGGGRTSLRYARTQTELRLKLAPAPETQE